MNHTSLTVFDMRHVNLRDMLVPWNIRQLHLVPHKS